MNQKDYFVFIFVKTVAWIIFVALCIEAGGLIVNFIFSVFKPEFVKNLYNTLDLTEIYKESKLVFFGVFSFVLFISILKAILFYVVVMLTQKMDLTKPFSNYVSNQILKISNYTLSIGVISFVAKKVSNSLVIYDFSLDSLNEFWVDSQAFILMGLVIHVIAIIFKKGIELQSENDLTV